MSREAYHKLQKELEYLKTTRRSEIARALEEARSLGDLRENAEYQEAREAQAALEERIKELEEMLRTAEVVEASSRQKGEEAVVRVGCEVEVEREEGEVRTTYTIVSPHEADSASGKISYESPLGAALMGARPGTVVTVETPRGVQRYRVIAVR